ncbi:MAG: TOTE conflict system archaeo-eukaryotic primase domain-containing protein [Syntrophobacteraceae bacterium]
MEFETLLAIYESLLAENKALKEENLALRARLGPGEHAPEVRPLPEEIPHRSFPAQPSADVNVNADPSEKIRLFLSLFKGREDVYAKRWESRDGTRAGYMPVCLNDKEHGVCKKFEVKCASCAHRSYAPLNEKAIDAHLRGKLIAGVYPLLQDETCRFLAIDFDKEGWQEDASTLRGVCCAFNIPVAFERSRSGQGAHAWFFFTAPISAAPARKFGSAMLTYAMSQRHEIKFKSYDRLFPNQATMPKGGFGNLIALPLQKEARLQGNSVFIDDHFRPYEDQWDFLAKIRRLSEEEITVLTSQLSPGSELGDLKLDDEEPERPWERKDAQRARLSRQEFPSTVRVVKANMLFIDKSGISQRALNTLKRLAAFKNPEFYRLQAMRRPTWKEPPILSCSEETPEYLCLPRGCDVDLEMVLKEAGITIQWVEKTHSGRTIKVAFAGVLREEQEIAAQAMLQHDFGVLSAATAFGKTVVAASLIAERKVITLILTHRQQLLSQWVARLAQFLKIDEELPLKPGQRGRRPVRNIIGQIGAGKDNPNGIIDVGIMQSLIRDHEVKDCVRDYGMVIVDECHHISAVSFEQIIKKVRRSTSTA